MTIWKRKTVSTGIILYWVHGFTDNGAEPKQIVWERSLLNPIRPLTSRNCKKNGLITGLRELAMVNLMKPLVFKRAAMNGKLILHGHQKKRRSRSCMRDQTTAAPLR